MINVAPVFMAERDRLGELVGRGPVVVLTGAGLSTGSGIPAYRDQHGQWQHSQPIQHYGFLGSAVIRYLVCRLRRKH